MNETHPNTTPRLAYIVGDPGVAPFGRKGASVHVQELLRAWRERGYAVRLYCVRAGEDCPSDLTDIPVTEIRLDGGKAPTVEREKAAARAADQLADWIIADGCDVVHERYSLFSSALATVTRELGVPGILEVNSPLIDEQEQYRELVDRAGAVAVLHRQLAAASVTTAVSEPVAQWLRELDVPSGQGVRVVANGVNPDRLAPPSDLGASETPALPVAVFVGTLKPWHGVEQLVRAAWLGQGHWQLRIVGDGPSGQQLRGLAAELGVEVDFRGAVAPEEMPSHLAGVGVGVAPYPQTEEHYFSPLKVYEYAAVGLPIVATEIGEIPNLVRTGQTGELLADANPAELDAAIRRVLSAPERSVMGERARELVCREHSWARVLGRTVEGLSLPERFRALDELEATR